MSRVATVVLTLGVSLLVFAGPAAAVDSFFDIFTGGPSEGFSPFPTHDQGIGHMVGNGFLLDLNEHQTIAWMSTGDGALLGGEVLTFNGLLPPDEVSDVSYLNVVFRPDLGGHSPWPDDAYFVIHYELDIPGGGPSHLVPLQPGVPGSFFDLTSDVSFIGIRYRVEVGPGGGCQDLHMSFGTGGLIPNQIQIASAPNGESVFDVYFHLGRAPFYHDDPIDVFTATTRGEYIAAPLSTQPATWGKIKSLYRQ